MTIDDLCSKLGQEVMLEMPDGWKSPIYRAIIVMDYGKLYYIGNARHDLTKLSKDAWVNVNYKKFRIMNAEKVVFDRMPLTVIAKLEEINGNEVML